MSKINDGGPAFPLQEPQALHAKAAAAIEGIMDSNERDRLYTLARAAAVGGMSLRDFFATHAPAVPEDFGWIDGETDCVQRIVRWNWCYANAMLAARGAQ